MNFERGSVGHCDATILWQVVGLVLMLSPSMPNWWAYQESTTDQFVE
jgi:hypothetical protein